MKVRSEELAAQLHNLRTFLAIFEAGSIAAAAETLHRAPSALSRSMREVETVISAPLFVRTRRGMDPTEYGRVLHARVLRIRDEIETAAAEIAADAGKGGASAGSIACLVAGQILIHPIGGDGRLGPPTGAIALSNAGCLGFMLAH